MPDDSSLIPAGRIENANLLIRKHKVLLDADLAGLYGVSTKVLLQAVKRNLDRFPDDFMFQLTKEEFETLRSQIVTSKGRGGRRYRPFVFTEQGVAMLSSVLKSDRAVRVNIEIMRAFVRLRQMLASHEELGRKLDALEKKYDAQFQVVFEAIRQLMTPPAEKKTGKDRIQAGNGEMRAAAGSSSWSWARSEDFREATTARTSTKKKIFG